VNSSRHFNTSLFVTVLSACLGLLIIGVPAQAQTGLATDITWQSKAPAVVKSLLNRQPFISPLAGFVVQVEKLAAIYNAHFSFDSCPERGEPEAIFYQNTRALSENNQVLVVTRLPRAALSVLLAKRPAMD